MELTESQQVLADTMSEISEFCWFAGWLTGTEYRLWRFMTDPSDDGAWGSRSIPDGARDELRGLSDIAGGWIYWNGEADVSSSGHGTTFVPLAPWSNMFEDWQRRTPQQLELPRRYLDYSEAYALLMKHNDQRKD